MSSGSHYRSEVASGNSNSHQRGPREQVATGACPQGSTIGNRKGQVSHSHTAGQQHTGYCLPVAGSWSICYIRERKSRSERYWDQARRSGVRTRRHLFAELDEKVGIRLRNGSRYPSRAGGQSQRNGKASNCQIQVQNRAP